jgi:prepilin-type N-terminal cleavage/methylation domain-containing protein
MKFRGVHQGSCRALSRQHQAYTLVEVMIAALILAVVATAYYGGLASGFAVTDATREDLRATQILMQRIEAIRLCTWGELSNFSFNEPYDPLGTTNQTSGALYYGTVSISPATNIPPSLSYASNVRQVTVSITWTNNNAGRPLVHNRQAQTLVARYGLQNYIWGAIP